MIRPKSLAARTLDADRVFDALVAQVSAKLEAGEPVDPDEFADEYPEHIERLRKLFPTLRAMAELGHSLTEPPAAPGADESAEQVGGALGDYRILREIGRGGMGVVYEAEQISLGRRVALKVLPFAAVLDQRQLQRFKNEAQAAALLHHQNIVPIYSVGCERGVHYYAMQFVQGHTLAELITRLRQASGGRARLRPSRRSAQRSPLSDASDTPCDGSAGLARAEPRAPSPSQPAQKRAPPPPTPRPDATTLTLPELATTASTTAPAFFRSVAQLGIQVSEALDHAHQLGVVHRDIKPSNILVDAQGKPWITDFGLARIETGPTLTVTGDLLGTLRYMSPEQALAKRVVIDHRSDIYSLGATLYELLTLRPVFDGDNRRELLRQIAFEEPRAPRRLNKAIPADLETILLKAIAKNPAERYATAQHLADDLRRFLDLKPIRAKRPTVLRRAAKWARRHKGAVASAAALLLMAVVGLAVSTILIWQEKDRTDQENLRAEAALVEAKAQEAEAQRQRQRAVDQEMVARARAAEATAAKKRAEDAAAENKAVLKFLAKDLLGSASPEKALGRDVTVKEVLANAEKKIDEAFEGQPLVEAAVRHTMGTVYRRLGQYEAAERHLTRACEIRARELGPEHPGTLMSINNLGIVLEAQGKVAEARKLYEQTLAIHKRIRGPEHPDTLASMNNLAMVLCDQGKREEARKLYEQTLAIHKRIRGPEHPGTLTLMNNVAAMLLKQRELDQARKLWKEALEIQTRILGPEHPDTLRSMASLAIVMQRQGKLEEARKLCEETLGIQKRVLGPEHRDTLRSMHNLAVALRRQGKLEEARKLHEETLAIQQRVLGPQHPDTLRSISNLATVLNELGKLEEARKLLEETLLIKKRVLGPEHPHTLASMNNLAVVMERQGKLEEARKLHEERLAILRRILGPEHPDTLLSTSNLACVLREQGKLAEARKLEEQTVAVRKRILGPEHPSTLRSMNNVALVLSHQGKLPEARKLHEQTLAIRKRVLGPEHPDTLASMNNLANVLDDLGKWEEARKLYEETLAVTKRVLGAEHPETLASMNNLAIVLRKQGKLEEARKLHEETLAVSKRVRGAEHPYTLASMNNVALVLSDQGKLPEARKLHKQTLAIRKRVLGPEHPDTLASMNNLALVLQRQGKLEEARKLYEETLAVRKRVLGPEHPDALRSMASLGFCYATQGAAHYRADQWQAAVQALAKSTQLRNDGLPWRRFYLAMARWQLGEKDEARRDYTNAVKLMKANTCTCRFCRDLPRIRKEAAALLGIEDAPAPNKKEVTPGKE